MLKRFSCVIFLLRNFALAYWRSGELADCEQDYELDGKLAGKNKVDEQNSGKVDGRLKWNSWETMSCGSTVSLLQRAPSSE